LNLGRWSILALELETAKSILAEVFHARPSDVEDMIQKRLEEKSWIDESRLRKTNGRESSAWVSSHGQEL